MAKGAENKVGVFPTWPIVMVGFADVTEAAKYPLLPALTSETSNEQSRHSVFGNQKRQIAITNKNKHPEATMRWLDHMYSQKGSISCSPRC